MIIWYGLNTCDCCFTNIVLKKYSPVDWLSVCLKASPKPNIPNILNYLGWFQIYDIPTIQHLIFSTPVFAFCLQILIFCQDWLDCFFPGCCIRIDDWGHFRVDLDFVLHIWYADLPGLLPRCKGCNQEKASASEAKVTSQLSCTSFIHTCRVAWFDPMDIKENGYEIEKLLGKETTIWGALSKKKEILFISIEFW